MASLVSGLRFKLIFIKHHSPRWLVFLIDVLICSGALLLAYWIRFNFTFPPSAIKELQIAVPIILSIRILSFVVSRVYSGIVRYTSFKDIQRIVMVIGAGSVALLLINSVFLAYGKKYFIPNSVLVMDFFISIYFMITFRLLTKSLFNELSNTGSEQKNLLIFGAKELALLTKRAISFDNKSDYKVIGFVDNEPNVRNRKLEGLPIYHFSQLRKLVNQVSISGIVFAKENVSVKTKEVVAGICLEKDIEMLKAPNIQDWIRSGLKVGQLKNLKIEDLLSRKPINIARSALQKDIEGRTVMVTGAAGSIGSELVRQLRLFNPRKILLIDQAESAMYDLELELKEEHSFFDFLPIISDITNRERMRAIFALHKPEMVFHAAAYKHVPMMEDNPCEAAFNNILGTKVIADLAVDFGVEKFVMVSTDKAVRPTNVMGTTKRIAEMYIQSLNEHCNTSFITTRFGNVLGSNGSVIPRFKKQIEEGGPVTVTHPDITRYFMTIPEACQLILEAGTMGNGGEIFIFDMGEPVKIVDLAKKMINLSGLLLNKDIEIKFTGLRPGEKLYEELLRDGENDMPTYHPQIMIAKVNTPTYKEVSEQLTELSLAVKSVDKLATVKLMKTMVPDYISNNSEFEALDKAGNVVCI